MITRRRTASTMAANLKIPSGLLEAGLGAMGGMKYISILDIDR